MKKFKLLFLAFLSSLPMVSRADLDSSDLANLDTAIFRMQTGTVVLNDGLATLTVPQGFKYMGVEGSRFLLEKFWNNPPQEGLQGMLFPENGRPMIENWAYVIQFEPIGYVKDNDAADINYQDLLKEMQKEIEDANAERTKQGYTAVHLVGWASSPFYDNQRKALHWAKELKFGDTGQNTLNYNIRILGRKGVLSLNAVAMMTELDVVKPTVNDIIGAIQFNEGHRYADFDSKVDDVAAWTIGGLVAGKLLAKAGLFAVLLKFWKFIAIGVLAAGAWVWRKIRGGKAEEAGGSQPEA